jgi:hypothetical protein
MKIVQRAIAVFGASIAVAASASAQAVVIDTSRTDNLPVGMGQMSLSNATINLTNGNLEIVFVPLDERILRLLTKDSYLAMQRLISEYRTQIDSVGSLDGVTDPGIALVSFHATAQNTRFDPALLTLTFHGQQFRPVGWVPLSADFSNLQLDVRQQVQALLLYRRDIPVKEAFTLSYLAATNDDWANRLTRFDSERSRILGRVRLHPDTSGGHH